MPWLTDHFILTLKRVKKHWTLCLLCEDCGLSYPLQSGELHQLSLRENLERQIIRVEQLHDKECRAKSVPNGNGKKQHTDGIEWQKGSGTRVRGIRENAGHGPHTN